MLSVSFYFSGIGAMISAGFVANGATVYIASRKDTSAYCSLLNEQGPGKAYSLQVDLSKPEDVVSLVSKLAKLEPAVHILVNNSGTNWSESIDTYSPQAFDSVLALNVRAVFDLTSKCIPLLTSGSTPGDPARVINISR
jgi:NAD(P)-dependent dehydrogenase (short-subunit alcohol dehydrogenase family)